MSMRVLILPRHSSQAASCRHRFLQYLPYLAANGFACDVVPFFDERYTAAVLQTGDKQWWRYATALTARARVVVGPRRRYDLVVVHAEFVPFLPFALERWLAARATPYVVDFDDAFFHAYDQHGSAVVRRLLGGKLGRLMAGAALNTAGSDYLAAYAARFSERVAVVPTVVDLARYPRAPVERTGSTFAIGWIGSPATTPHLQGILPELAAFAQGRDVKLVAIGARRFDTGSLPVEWIDWAEATEVAALAGTDVGIMPLPDTPWARGKCGFKLIQAMACWKPVVASPVGANAAIVDDGVTGFLAAAGTWAGALDRLHRDPALRDRLGRAGRRRVEQSYSLSAWAPHLQSLWSSAAGPQRGQIGVR